MRIMVRKQREDQWPVSQRLESIIQRLAPTDLSVLITGGDRVGREQVARRLFAYSLCPDGCFVKVSSRVGPSAWLGDGVPEGDSGLTFFFDEIGILDEGVQASLLRLILSPYRVRILAGTGTVLHDLVRKGRFRQDLYYRLNFERISLSLPSAARHGNGVSLREAVRHARGEVERKVIAEFLRRNEWDLKKTAAALHFGCRSLLKKMRQFQMGPEQASPDPV